MLAYQLPCGRGDGLQWLCRSALDARRLRCRRRHDPALSLWIRFPPEESEVALEAKDSSGQTLRFPIGATIEYPKAGDWQYVVVPLSAKHGGGIKGRLEEIGIVVQARGGVTVRGGIIQGSVSFDEVRLRESDETFHIDAAAQAEPPPASLSSPLGSSELAARLGVNIHLLNDDPALDLAHAAGFGFVRMDMLWANVERGSRYLSFFASGRRGCLQRAGSSQNGACSGFSTTDIRIMGGNTPRTPQDVAAFSRFFAEARPRHISKAAMSGMKSGMNRIRASSGNRLQMLLNTQPFSERRSRRSEGPTRRQRCRAEGWPGSMRHSSARLWIPVWPRV